MLRLEQLKLNIHHDEKQLIKKAARVLGIPASDILQIQIVKQSLDARDKNNILYSYAVDIKVKDEKGFERYRYEKPEYTEVRTVSKTPEHRPVIIGCGPAGLFAGLTLARAGLCPVIIERGKDAVSRKKDVDLFWEDRAKYEETGSLSDSNVCFGEGGAGTFSDGKLNTLAKNADGRHTAVLEAFVEFGADPEILYVQKPHIGTDRLIEIVTNMRREIERLGGTVRFGTKLDGIDISDGKIRGLYLRKVNGASDTEASGCVTGAGDQRGTDEYLSCDRMILAIGHSARDTFYMLRDAGIYMEQKAFAAGVRIQHPQKMIDEALFGAREAEFLSPGAYKLTGKGTEGRGVYSFCMCPGGYVCDASTESGMTAVNGMSYHGRNSVNANSALIVTVNPGDFGGTDVLAGIELQRKLETAAYMTGRGAVPTEIWEDFRTGCFRDRLGDVEAVFKGNYELSPLHEILPDYIAESLKKAMPDFGRRIKGFDRPDAVLAGVESRTSSPVRIVRGQDLNSNVRGIYPCGEGAGYAGGITSAAMDGMRVAAALIDELSVD